MGLSCGRGGWKTEDVAAAGSAMGRQEEVAVWSKIRVEVPLRSFLIREKRKQVRWKLVRNMGPEFEVQNVARRVVVSGEKG
jgi:hypothetical protein